MSKKEIIQTGDAMRLECIGCGASTVVYSPKEMQGWIDEHAHGQIRMINIPETEH